MLPRAAGWRELPDLLSARIAHRQRPHGQGAMLLGAARFKWTRGNMCVGSNSLVVALFGHFAHFAARAARAQIGIISPGWRRMRASRSSTMWRATTRACAAPSTRCVGLTFAPTTRGCLVDRTRQSPRSTQLTKAVYDESLAIGNRPDQFSKFQQRHERQ